MPFGLSLFGAFTSGVPFQEKKVLFLKLETEQEEPGIQIHSLAKLFKPAAPFGKGLH